MAHRTKPKGKGAISKWKKEHKSGAKPLTDKDKNDIRKENETAKLPKKFKLAGESNLSKEEFNKKYGVKENINKLKENTSKPNVAKASNKKKTSKPNLVKTPSPTWGVKKNKHGEKLSQKKNNKETPKEDKTVNNKTVKDKEAKATSDKEWLKKTRNSPAARAGIGDKQRLAARERHQKFKADRAKSKADRKAGVKKKRKLKIATWRDLE